MLTLLDFMDILRSAGNTYSCITLDCLGLFWSHVTESQLEIHLKIRDAGGRKSKHFHPHFSQEGGEGWVR